MAKFKVLEGSWKDQIGEFVSELVEAGAEGEQKVAAVVLRMAGNRLVEFKPERVAPAEDEAEPKAAE